MGNLLGALLALIGVIVGVVTTSWSERNRWKRTQAIRWDERRVDAYAEYARAIKRIHMTALEIVDPSVAGTLSRPINYESSLEKLDQAEANRAELWETMLLLANQPTAFAALQWHNAVKRETQFARTHPADSESDEWRAAMKNVDQARDLFYEAARNSLDVGGGSVAFAQLLQSASYEQAVAAPDL